MRKKIVQLTVLAFLVCLLAGCGHTHEWKEATCETPKTCTGCEETEGEALGHAWLEASCVHPRTCSVCKVTEGTTLEHTWQEATCTNPQYCSACGQQEGEPLRHIPFGLEYSYGTWEENAENGEVVFNGTCTRCMQDCSINYSDGWEGIAKEWLYGKMVPLVIITDTEVYDIPDELKGDYVIFNEDRAEVVLMGTEYKGQWLYQEVLSSDSGNAIQCFIDTGEGPLGFILSSPENIWISLDENLSIFYKRETTKPETP